jgi:hypothetical protein
VSAIHVFPPGKAQAIRQAIKDSIAQLGRSERGQQTMHDFRVMLRNGATSLDEENMVALCILVESVRTGFVGSVLEALSDKLDQQQAEQMAEDTASMNREDLC